MAVLGSEILLTNVVPDTFLGVSPGSTKSEIVVSHSDSVVVFEVVSRKPISSWNASGGGMALKVAAAFNFTDSILVAGLVNDTLRKWSPSVDRITQGQKIQLGLPLLSIWSDKRFPEVLLLYRNGSIDQLTGLQRLFTSSVPENEDVLFLRVAREKNGVHVTYLTADVEEWIFHHVFIDKNSLSANHRCQALPADKKLLSPKVVCVVSGSNSTLDIYILWSDGFLRAGSVTQDGFGSNWVDLFPIEEAAGNGLVSLRAFGDQFLVATANEISGAMCMLYNIKYGVLSSSITIDRVDPVRQLQLHVAGSNYLLQLDSDLLMLTYSSQSTLLSDLIGVKSAEPVKPTHGLIRSLEWTNDGLKTGVSRRLPTEIVRLEFSPHFLEKVGALENGGVSDHLACVSLLDEFLRKKEFDFILEVYRYYRHLPEKCIVDTLQTYLSEKINCEEIVNSERFHRNVKQKRDPFIDQILSFRINETLMQDHVQRLSTEQVLFLVWYLFCLLEDSSLLGGSRSPDPANIVEWMNILLDSHYRNILLRSNTAWVSSLLRDFSSATMEMCKHAEEFQTLKEIISSLLSRRGGAKRKRGSKEYEIKICSFP